MISVVAFTRNGCRLGRLLADQFSGTLYTPDRFTDAFSAQPFGELSQWTRARFEQQCDLIFVSATGIAVRSIAPWVRDKFTDPAVVAVDEQGRYVVPLLPGHVGGGNVLARRVAELTGGVPVISTATDLNGLFAVDLWAKKNQLIPAERELVKEISGALLDGKPVGFASDVPVMGQLPAGLVSENTELGICVTESPENSPFPRTLHLIPKNLAAGLGCKRGTTKEHLEEMVALIFQTCGLDIRRVQRAGTIDLKRDEAGLLAFCRAHCWPVTFFPPNELEQAQGDFTPSPFAQQVTGVDNVCERAAVCLGGTLVVPKQAQEGVTVAVSRLAFSVRFEEP